MSGSQSLSRRVSGLDRARGLAVLAMIVYHFAWDLSHFGLIETNVAVAPAWKLFAQTIAASFLFISGISLHLATVGGLDRGAFLRRLALVSGAAGLVTLATWLAFPQSYVFFGILHCIAASTVIAVFLRTLPAALIGLIGIAIIALPFMVRSSVFETAWLAWVGLGVVPPSANDYVPVFPWSGFVVLGLAVSKAFARAVPVVAGTSPDPLAWVGRHSLAIYLIHQPLLFGALALGVQSGLLPNRQQEAGITRACALECQVSGAPPSVCLRACACATQALRALPLWQDVLRETLSPDDQRQADAIGRACYLEASKPQPARSAP